MTKLDNRQDLRGLQVRTGRDNPELVQWINQPFVELEIIATYFTLLIIKMHRWWREHHSTQEPTPQEFQDVWNRHGNNQPKPIELLSPDMRPSWLTSLWSLNDWRNGWYLRTHAFRSTNPWIWANAANSDSWVGVLLEYIGHTYIIISCKTMMIHNKDHGSLPLVMWSLGGELQMFKCDIMVVWST